MNLDVQLVSIPTPRLEVGPSPSDLKRFAGGFFTQRFAFGHTRGLYAKTKTGVLYKYDSYHRTWRKHDPSSTPTRASS